MKRTICPTKALTFENFWQELQEQRDVIAKIASAGFQCEERGEGDVVAVTQWMGEAGEVDEEEERRLLEEQVEI